MKTNFTLLAILLLEFQQYSVHAQLNQNNWSVYFGGAKNEYAEEIDVDHEDNIIVTGKSTSSSGVATAGAHQEKYAGSTDAFVAKFDTAGNLIWSSYLGGPGDELAYALSIDAANNIFIGGKTTSDTGLSTPGSFQSEYGGDTDGFVAKFSPDGELLWCTYIGGTKGEWVLGLVNDAIGRVYVTGYTGSASAIATSDAYQPVYAGGMDCYLIKLSADGERTLYGTYFGGNEKDRPHDLQIDFQGHIILSGTTPSKGLGTEGVWQESLAGRADVFVSKWTPKGQLIWCTYIGGTGDDRGRESYTDIDGNIYITGFTTSESGIASSNAYQTNISLPQSGGIKSDAYLVKLNTNGQLEWGTYFGGPESEFGRGLRITSDNKIIISGNTSSSSQIATQGSFSPNKKGTSDSYFAIFSSTGELLEASYYGGSKQEPYDFGYGTAVAIDSRGNVFLAPTSNSNDIPNHLNSLYPGATDVTYDAVIARFSEATRMFWLREMSQMNQVQVSIYPNPATSAATLSFMSEVNSNIQVILSDFSGKKIYSFQMPVTEGANELEVKLDNIPSGAYFISIPEIVNSVSEKLVVNH